MPAQITQFSNLCALFSLFVLLCVFIVGNYPILNMIYVAKICEPLNKVEIKSQEIQIMGS